jgi:hypothetical protein
MRPEKPSFPGLANRIGALGAQLGPRALARKIAGRLQGEQKPAR